MRRLRILEAAVEEALEAAAWYEHERPGLGKDFHSALEFALDLLEDSLGAQVTGGIDSELF